MRRVAKPQKSKPIKQTEEILRKAQTFCIENVMSGMSHRSGLEASWKEVHRLYEGKPEHAVQNFPYPNAPNIEVSIIGIAVDAIYAQAIDLVFAVNPVLSVRSSTAGAEKGSMALQHFIDVMAEAELNLRPSSREVVFDCVKLGTGFFYVPWVDRLIVRDVQEVTQSGPMAIAVPPDDLYLPPDCDIDLDRARWLAYRVILTEGELRLRGKDAGWDLDKAHKMGHLPQLRQDREAQSGHRADNISTRDLYEIMDVYAYLDLDDDGIEEDVLIIWDKSSQNVLHVGYSPFDRRPFVSMPYQIRGHQPYGLGCGEVMAPYQKEITQVHNYRLANAVVASTRIWKARHGQIESTRRLHPGEVVHLSDPVTDLIADQQGSVGPDLVTAEGLTLRLAEQRVGLNELSAGRATGSRTPGITALTMMGQANKRFAAAFDHVRSAVAGAVKQGLFRYQEALLKGDPIAEDNILRMVNPQDAELVIDILRNPSFDEQYNIQLTATSAQVNKEADRQSALALFNLTLGYYEKLVEAAQIMGSPEVPQGVKNVVQKAVEASANLMEKTLRTFDIVSDPGAFLVQPSELEAANAQSTSMAIPPEAAGGLGGILGLLGGAGGMEQGAGGEGGM